MQDAISEPTEIERDPFEGDRSGIEIDLDAIETDLADVEIALARLESGTYWTCEITGQDLPDDVLFEHPTARRLPEQ
jgi:RNA polymerase-binding transcription factor DksA